MLYLMYCLIVDLCVAFDHMQQYLLIVVQPALPLATEWTGNAALSMYVGLLGQTILESSSLA